MIRMKQSKCKKCNEIVEGFSAKDLKHKKIMHMLKHRSEEEERRVDELFDDNQEVNNNGNN